MHAQPSMIIHQMKTLIRMYMCNIRICWMPYRIAINIGEVFNLAILWKIAKFKNPPRVFLALLRYAEALAFVKFKIHQCILMTVLPNLMLTKFPAICIGVGTGGARGAIAPPIFWKGGQSPP